MNVYGELIRAQLERWSSDPSGGPTSRYGFNTTEGRTKYYSGSAWRAYLANDDKLVIGNDGTADNNVRLNRSANATLQALLGGNATAEGSVESDVAEWAKLNVKLSAAYVDDYLDFDEQSATPGAPSAGTRRAYFKTDGKLYSQNSGGVETEVNAGTDFDVNSELSQSDLPNTTTVYGYNLNGESDYDDGDFVGTQALTENGAITAGNDALGNSRYCAFDGTAHLSSANAAFNFTGDFTIGLWVYRASWAAIGSDEAIISRTDGTDGWALVLEAARDEIAFRTYSTTETSAVRFGFTNLSAGWHHLTVVRDASNYTSIYCDGLLVAKVRDTAQAISEAGDLEIGAQNSGSDLFTGRMDEIVIHNGTVYTGDEVARLYCRSSRRKATEVYDSEGNTELEFVSPMEGQTIPYWPLIADNCGSDLGVAAGGFDEREFEYRVWKKKWHYSGRAACHSTPPSTVNTVLSMSTPLPYGDTVPERMFFKAKWFGAGVGFFDATMQFYPDGTNDGWVLFTVLNSSGAYAYDAALVDTIPNAWANNDSISFDAWLPK